MNNIFLVKCPTCYATVGDDCVSTQGKELEIFHSTRVALAATLDVDQRTRIRFELCKLKPHLLPACESDGEWVYMDDFRFTIAQNDELRALFNEQVRDELTKRRPLTR